MLVKQYMNARYSQKKNNLGLDVNKLYSKQELEFLIPKKPITAVSQISKNLYNSNFLNKKIDDITSVKVLFDTTNHLYVNYSDTFFAPLKLFF
jgi:hypothetical protein